MPANFGFGALAHDGILRTGRSRRRREEGREPIDAGALPGPTPVKSGNRTVGLLVPLKVADPDRLAAALTRAEALARGRDTAALAPFGDVDPVDWSIEALRAQMAERALGMRAPASTLVPVHSGFDGLNPASK